MRVVVLCPMAIEHRAVARAVQGAALDGVEVVQTGIGKDAVVRGVGAVGRGSDGGAALVVLAGACGGLRSVGDVPRIARVIDEHGGEWKTGDEGEGAVTLIGVDRVVSSPAEKAELTSRTGAAIVDMESHAFIAECERRGVKWAIVRGVSDTPEETLPNEVLAWIDGAGNTRVARAAWDMVRRPRVIGHIVPVVRRSQRVLPLVGARVVEVVRARRSGGGA